MKNKRRKELKCEMQPVSRRTSCLGLLCCRKKKKQRSGYRESALRCSRNFEDGLQGGGCNGIVIVVTCLENDEKEQKKENSS